MSLVVSRPFIHSDLNWEGKVHEDVRGETFPVQLVSKLVIAGVDFGFAHFEMKIIKGLPIEDDSI